MQNTRIVWRVMGAHLLYDVKLVDFAFAGEQRLPVNELAHDAAYGPHVDPCEAGWALVNGNL